MSNREVKTPLVGLIGLPNSGKSTLLNKICGKKKAITANEAHTTRDLNYGEDFWDGYYIRFVDTGGLVPDPETEIQKQVQVKSWGAIAEADILVWVIDRRQNTDTIRHEMMQRLWKTGKPFIVAINKVDDPNLDKDISEYVQLGGVDFVNVSASNGYGVNELMDKIVEQVSAMGFDPLGEVPDEFVNQQSEYQQKKGRKMKRINYAKDGTVQVTREQGNDGVNLFEAVETEDARTNQIEVLFFQEAIMSDSAGFIKKAIEVGYDCYDVTNIYEIEEILQDINTDKAKAVFFSKNAKDLSEGRDIGLWTIKVNQKTDLETELEKVERGFIERDPKPPRVLLLGKPNVGKSSLFNALCREDIQIVTEIAGTTLSVNDYLVEQPERNKKYLLMDTTGIRKPGKRTFGAETFATYKTVQAAHEADVVCLVLDASQPLANQDQIVAGIAKEAKKGTVIIANKSDLLDEEKREKFMKDFRFKFQFLKVTTFVWVSAKEYADSEDKSDNPGNINSIWSAIDQALEDRRKFISQAEVRKLFNYLMKNKPPKKLSTKKRPVIYDLKYTRSEPPTFELLLKDKTTVHWSYVRFIENQIRRQFDLRHTGVAIKLVEVNHRNVQG